MTNAISQMYSRNPQSVLPHGAAAKPSGNPRVAAAAAKSEQEVIKEYSQVYRSANGEGDMGAATHPITDAIWRERWRRNWR